MHAPVDQQIAPNPEKNDQVKASKVQIVVEQVVKAAKGRVHEPARGNEDQPAVQFWLRAPIDGQRHAKAEGNHVIERNTQKSIRALLMELKRVKAGHDDSRGNAQRNHHRREPRAKPSNGAMPTDFVYADQRGLSNEKDHPPDESRGVNPKNERPRHRGMEQVVVNRAFEARNHDGSQQQRHRKIKIAMHHAVSTGQGRRPKFFLRAQYTRDGCCVGS